MNANIKTVISTWVRDAREYAGLSGVQLGVRLAIELGVARGNTRANISHWENERHQPSVLQILAISKITGFQLPIEFAGYLPEPTGAVLEIPVDKLSRQIYALSWNSPDEIELLSEYRSMTDDARSAIRELIKKSPKDGRCMPPGFHRG
ncbi:helix-turn-helix transcriptional regulator [Undibacterium curvum]|uniref:Helix-turn-helix transcriptional regulator n=1 Tax=Undibacterium curvum TaxID=2762294 RepID=A0ABR7A514_9BURK|nr:helix-turn-helix transcriptional regulator [Undibacterium curvum]MBC3932000.1 helix-turn-helix transcriptional regulator [Undibacterium curvum]